jgi:hypothetical protein
MIEGYGEMQTRQRFRGIHGLIAVSTVSAVGAALFALGVGRADAATATTLTVDAGSDLGTFNNPAWYQNISKLGPNDLARVDEIAPKVARGWGNTAWYYNESTGQYTFNDTAFDQVTQYSDRMILNFDQCAQDLMTLSSPQQCREVLKTGIRHDKQRYPDLQYIEFFNESDKDWTLAPGEEPGLSVTDYYQWYKIGYSVINELNAELQPAIPLRIGGPAAAKFDTAYLTAFLDLYKVDTDPAKRLDFLSFHDYGHATNPSAVQSEKATVQGWLSARGLDTTIPVYVTEYGVFPGGASGKDASGNPTTLAADQITQAAAMSTLGGYFVRGKMDMPMQWIYEHSTNVRKSMFVNDNDGAVYPYYNVVKMEGMLKSHLINASSSTLTAGGIGVNALATKDDTGVAVLATNYQWTTGTGSHAVTLNVQNLPATFTNRQILVQRYLVDATTSNYTYSPASAELARVEQYVLPAGSSAVPKSFTLGPNAVSLVVLTPVTFSEGEALTPVISSGDQYWNITDTAASNGALSLFVGNAVGDYAKYTMQVPAAGMYHVKARMKRTPTRGVVQVVVNGMALGGPIDMYSAGYDYVDEDFGIRSLPSGANTLTFTLTAAGEGGGFSLGVDTLELLPAFADKVEAESRAPASPSGDAFYLLTESAASATGYVKVVTNAVGDSIRYTLMVPHGGDYELVAGVKKTLTRGICQYSVNGVDVGAPLDQYAPTAMYTALDVGRVQLNGPGLVTIGCRVTGKNPASTGYNLAMDYFLFQPSTS